MGAAILMTALWGVILAAVPAAAGLPPPPECTGASGVVVVSVGDPYTPTLTGTGSTTLTVSDTGSLPAGATLAPPSGSSSPSPFNVVFSWTPTPADAGSSYNIIIQFEDAFTSTGSCEFTIQVPSLVTTTTTNSTTTTLLDCGNNVVDAGEECDPPNGEICNNLVDDDADNLVDCADPDCEPLTQQSCGADCMFVEPCQPIEKDPATIRFDAGGDGLDAFWIHGRFKLQSSMDPSTEGFGVALSNANGLIYRATLEPAKIRRINGRYVFRDAGARRGESVTGGLYSAGIRLRTFGEVDYLVFRLRAYADFAAATESRMTTGIVVGNDTGSLTADWTLTRDGWRLSQHDF